MIKIIAAILGLTAVTATANTLPPTWENTLPPTWENTLPPTWENTLPPTWEGPVAFVR